MLYVSLCCITLLAMHMMGGGKGGSEEMQEGGRHIPHFLAVHFINIKFVGLAFPSSSNISSQGHTLSTLDSLKHYLVGRDGGGWRGMEDGGGWRGMEGNGGGWRGMEGDGGGWRGMEGDGGGWRGMEGDGGGWRGMEGDGGGWRGMRGMEGDRRKDILQAVKVFCYPIHTACRHTSELHPHSISCAYLEGR